MKYFSALLFFVLLSSNGVAQINFRNPEISAGLDGGGRLLFAISESDPQRKLELLDEFFAEHSDSLYRPHALYVALQAAEAAGKTELALDAGRELLKLEPADLEIRQRVNQALAALGRWDELGSEIAPTRSIAEAAAAHPGPGSEYAVGVLEWLAWAVNAAMISETDLEKKMAWLDRITKEYPDSPYAKDAAKQYVLLYQQAGNTEKMLEAIRTAIDAGVEDPFYYHTLSEHAVTRKNDLAANAYAVKTLKLLETQPKPETMSPAEWEAYVGRIAAYAHFTIGRIATSKGTEAGYRTGQVHLSQAAGVIRTEGGERYNVLAYLLGICFTQLDSNGENVQSAIRWMREATRSSGPYQELARRDLGRLHSAAR